MQTKRSRGTGLEINFWPSYTDIGMLMILILILFLFIQIAFNSQVFKIHTIQTKQTRIKKALEDAVKNAGVGDSVKVETGLESQKITFSDKILFASGQADLKKEGIPILEIVGKVLLSNEGVYRSIRIEGHTDNVKLEGGNYRSNWDLSSSRATVVVEFLNKLGLDPKDGKLYAAGYSEFSPVGPNDTNDERALNRRIEMIINYKADDSNK